jgi:tRNA(fMet)-specific endonuclease VapC
MIEFLLDTDIISEAAKERGHPLVCGQVERNAARSAIAATSWFELKYGVSRLPPSRRRTELEDWLEELAAAEVVVVLPYDAPAAEIHGERQAALEARGITVSWSDGQIAAVAVANDLTLVTRNVRDFERFEGLRIENWFEG